MLIATLAETTEIVAMRSANGGAWSELRALTPPRDGRSLGVGLGFDGAAQRFVAAWSCCGDTRFGGAAAASHSAAWFDPQRNVWLPEQPAARELISGARAAGLSVMAQSLHSRSAWLIWVEDGNRVWARSLDFAQIIPQRIYPTPTREVQP